MSKRRNLVGLCLILGVSISIAFLWIVPAGGATLLSQPPTPGSPPVELAERTGLPIDLVAEMLAAGIPQGAINQELAAEWPAHLEKLAEKDQRRHLKVDLVRTEAERLRREAQARPSTARAASVEDGLWIQIETAIDQGQEEKALELAQALPPSQRLQLENSLNPTSLDSPAKPDAYIIGRNGDDCSYYNFTDAMNDAADGDIIYIESAYGPYNLVFGTITKTLTFAPSINSCRNPSASTVTLDGSGTSQLGRIQDGAVVTFTNMILTNGTYGLGGILYVSTDSHATLDNTDLTLGSASSKGGGLRIFGGSVLMINDSEIINNQTTGSGDGAGVAIDHGTLIMHDASRVGDFTDQNTSADTGGGVYMNGGRLEMYDDSRIRSNVATTQGGGVYATNAARIALHNNATIGYVFSTSDNDAFDGGGLYLTGAGTTLSMDGNSAIEYNYATNYGGGLYITGGASADIDSAMVNNNEALEKGGGIYVDGAATVNMHNSSQLSYNLTSDAIDSYGAGMYIWDAGAVVTVSASTVMSNVSTIDYGGIRLFGNSTLYLDQDTSILHNHANSGFGGGLAISGTLYLDQAAIQYNSADSSGGGISMNGGYALITDPDIRFNNANDHGGGIYQNGGELTLRAMNRDAYLAANTAGMNGGGYYLSSATPVDLVAWNGYSFGINSNNASQSGGGVFLTNGAYLDVYGWLEMTSNSAHDNGGAIYLEDSSTARLNDYNFTGYIPKIMVNTAYNGDGGGIYALDSQVYLYGAQIGHPVNGNDAPTGNGGGVYLEHSNLTMQNTVFQNNSAANDGGGIAAVMTSTALIDSVYGTAPALPSGTTTPEVSYTYCDPNTLPTDRYCTEFRYNDAGDDGGAIYSDHSTLSIEHTAFFTNTSSDMGSAIRLVAGLGNMYGSLLVGNDCSGISNVTVHVYPGGGGSELATFNALNNTWTNNPDYAITYAAGTNGSFNNNIVWGNSYRGSITPQATAACNDTQTSALSGLLNISQDPEFFTSTRGAYRLAADSPAIDQCASGDTPDLDGFARPFGDDYDIGAFESHWYFNFLPLIVHD